MRCPKVCVSEHEERSPLGHGLLLAIRPAPWKTDRAMNEVNVSRFFEIAGQPGSFSATAGKMVDGKEIVMGTGNGSTTLKAELK
ncbi:MAG TPA: hypothetical protein VGM27_05930 [Acidobacteriaceae bacterium]|jgi:hypothetical protein